MGEEEEEEEEEGADGADEGMAASWRSMDEAAAVRDGLEGADHQSCSCAVANDAAVSSRLTSNGRDCWWQHLQTDGSRCKVQ